MNKKIRLLILACAMLLQASVSIAVEAEWNLIAAYPKTRDRNNMFVCFHGPTTEFVDFRLVGEGPRRLEFFKNGEPVNCASLLSIDFERRELHTRGAVASEQQELRQFLSKPGAWDQFEELRTDYLERKIVRDREVYLNAYVSSTTLEKLYDFEKRYANNDPDSLIPKLAPIKANLKREELSKEIDLLAQKIRWCHQQTVNARLAIERERRVASVSGYENKMVLRQAGEIIISCQDSIPRDYAEYRKIGGTTALGNLR